MELQLTIIFIINQSADYFYNQHFKREMPKEHCPLQFPRTQSDIFKIAFSVQPNILYLLS